MKTFVKKNHFVIFILLTFVLSWFPWYAGIVWHAAINFWAPILLSDSSLVAAQEGTHLPTIAPNLYLTVLSVQVVGAIILAIVTKGKLGEQN